MSKYLSSMMAVLIVFTTNEALAVTPEKQSSSGILNEIRVGLALHDVATRVNKHEDGVDLSFKFYFTSPDNAFFNTMGKPRPMLGASLHSGNETHQFYMGFSWQFKADETVFFSFDLGGAVHTGELESSDPECQRLGSRVLFRLAAGFGFMIDERWNVSLAFDHISNAGLADPNNGLETFGVQVGYVF